MAEFLALSSTCSFMWSLAYLLIGRRQELSAYGAQIGTWATGYLLVYLLCMLLFYSLLPIVLSRTSAAVFNLSMMTVNIFSLIAGFLVFGDRFTWTLIIAFVLITAGLILYNLPLGQSNDDHPVDPMDQLDQRDQSKNTTQV